MKRVVTGLFVTSLLVGLGASNGGAQSISMPRAELRPVPVTTPTQAYKGGSAPAGRDFFHAHMSPLAAADVLGYFQDNGFTLWQSGDTIFDPTTMEPRLSPDNVPYIRLENLERFDAPGTTPMLDSVHFTFIIDSIGLGTGNKFVVEVMDNNTQQYKDGSGNTYDWPVPWANAPLLTKSNKTSAKNLLFTASSKMHAHQIIDTTLSWAKDPVAIDMSDTLGDLKGTFSIGLSSYNLGNGNSYRMFADSTNEPAPGRLIDPTIDRMYWMAYSADGHYFIRDFWGGHYFTDAATQESIYYPNFIMIAYTHDADAAVDNKTPATPYRLSQNYPNPVVATSDISYDLGANGPVSLKVYNSVGTEVATLVNGVENAGSHEVTFDVKDLPNGMYFYKLQSGEFNETKSLVVTR